MRYFILAILLLTFQNSKAQNQNDRFIEKAGQIENLLRYKSKSPVQLRSLMNELKSLSSGNELQYEILKKRVNNYLLPIEIKLTRSDIYNHRFRDAVNKTYQIKNEYPFNDDIENLENYLDKKLFKSYKAELIEDRNSWFSLEPSITFFSQEVPLKEFKKASNMNPVYGIGLYYKYKRGFKTNSMDKQIAKYSQIGFKIDIRDTNYTILGTTGNQQNAPYVNPQLSFLFGRTLGLDFGVLHSSLKNNPIYTATGSFYIPMGAASIGVTSRILTSFNNTLPSLQVGGSLKFNLGFYKSFTRRDAEEINVRILKFKENK